ncbi:MAG: SDR family oxidoreductase [Nitrospinaceae bacterium]
MSSSVIAITGASRGIGRAIAVKFAQEGYAVALSGRNVERLETAVALIREQCPKSRLLPVVSDVRDAASVRRFFDECQSALGPPEVFVNNAGVGHPGRFLDLTENQMQELIDINFRGSVWAMYYALKGFEAQGRGVLVNISSTTILQASPHAALYAAAKQGIHGLINSLEKQYIGHETIRLINIAPGPTLTGFYEGKAGEICKDHVIHPEDVAETVYWAVKTPSNYRISSVTVRPSGDFRKQP